MATRPRVVFAIGGLSRGGSERQLMELVAAAHPERIEATIVTLSRDCDPGHRETLRELGVELIQMAPASGPRALRPIVTVPRTYATLRRIRPDVVYAWLEEAATTMTPAAAALGVPLVVARRSVCGSPAERWAFFRVAIRAAERRAKLVTGNSEAVLAEAERRGIPAAKLRLTRNGHREVAPLPLPESDPVRLGYLANYRPEKGQARLLAALELVDAGTPWRVDMVGSGPLREDIARESEARGLGDRVEAGGPVTDIDAFWADHDIAVLLSDNEGSPNSMIEAAMLGRPLLGTDGGGTREIVSPDGGLLVSHDPAEIAAAITKLIDSPDLRRSMATASHRHATTQHDYDAFVEAHLAALGEAIG
jgi:glycosyltransferase involved in cell wall biosynthesis